MKTSLEQLEQTLETDLNMAEEFFALDEQDIDAWLADKGFDTTVAQLKTALPKQKLEDEDLENLSGGTLVQQKIEYKYTRPKRPKIGPIRIAPLR